MACPHSGRHYCQIFTTLQPTTGCGSTAGNKHGPTVQISGLRSAVLFDNFEDAEHALSPLDFSLGFHVSPYLSVSGRAYSRAASTYLLMSFSPHTSGPYT